MRPATPLLAIALGAANVHAQQWVCLDGPVAAERAVAFDTRRGRAVLFGSEGETWEYAGSTRLHRPTSQGPFARTGHAMVYDQARGHTLLFGGRRFTSLGDTWLWDGCNWRQSASVVSPPRRFDAAMAYDSARNRVVLFGGVDGIALRDTWEHDGTQWIQCTPLTAPHYVNSAQMAFDSARNVSVLVVNGAGSSRLEVFEWNGNDWAWRLPPSGPAFQPNYTLAYDPLRQRTVLLYAPSSASEVWEWDGNAWHLVPATVPFTAIRPGMYFDAVLGATVIAGHDEGRRTGAWTWNGTTFASLWPIHSPPVRSGHALYQDTARNRSVMFGGLPVGGDTWEWDGQRFTERSPASSPPRREDAMACFDPVTATGLLFGGSDGPTFLADCWRFDGTTWTQLSTATPSPRSEAAMAWDPVRNEAILFGGLGQGAWLGDTWRWNGTAWAQASPVSSPSARSRHAMAFDPQRGRMVLFGGAANGVAPVHHRNDTWEWDGAQWQAIAPAQSPPALLFPSMIHDPVSSRIVLAGLVITAPVSDHQIWEYDGTTWTLVLNGPANVAAGRLVWDALRQRRVMFDGRTVGELTPGPADVVVLGSGCGAPAPLLAARARPRTGASAFGFELVTSANVPVLFALGLGSGNTPLGNGCTLLVQQVSATVFASSNGSGMAVLPAPMPATLALRGFVVHAQAGALVPSAPGGLTVSHSLRVTVGD